MKLVRVQLTGFITCVVVLVFQYGLYSSVVGGFIYAIFGTIPELNIAPTALLSLLTHSYTHHSHHGAVPSAVLLCFLSGIVELLCGILHLGKVSPHCINYKSSLVRIRGHGGRFCAISFCGLNSHFLLRCAEAMILDTCFVVPEQYDIPFTFLGFLVDFVSLPVVAGFTSAGAMTIASAQVKNLLGLKFNAESFAEVWKKVAHHITEIRPYDASLGLFCCAFLLLLRASMFS